MTNPLKCVGPKNKLTKSSLGNNSGGMVGSKLAGPQLFNKALSCQAQGNLLMLVESTEEPDVHSRLAAPTD